MDKNRVCSFTGHRLHTLRLPHDEQLPPLIALKSKLKEEIERHIKELNVKKFISGLAIGTDIWSCEIVLELMNDNKDIALEVAIPFIGQTEKWTNKALAKYKSRHEAILNDSRVINTFKPDSEYLKDKSYQRRNKYLVDECHYLIAVWNGSSSGTSTTIKLAQNQGKVCTIINPLEYKNLANTEK